MLRVLLTIICIYCFTGCSEQPLETGAIPDIPRFTGERLAKGRSIRMGTCRNCHLLGVSGAPAVTDESAWTSRINKDTSTLYRSALHGIMGDDGKFRMPPRGGNSRLTDEEVRQAVDFMIASVVNMN
jgi:cytochrome c5